MAKKEARKVQKKTNSFRLNGNRNLEKSVMENSVALQKVLTNLSVELSGLSKKLSRLLDLFESSAKILAEKEKPAERNKRNEKEVSDKLDNLMEQNKVLARGLTLLHETNLNMPEEMQEREGMQRNPVSKQQPNPQQMQRMPPKPLPQKKQMEMGEYQKSISSK